MMLPGNGRYLRVAHRGASDLAPENTLKAYRLALELGADMNEVDVHLTRDGEAVLRHDETVCVEGGVRRRLDAMRLAELRAVDAGEGERVPTLQEAMELHRDGGGLYIELKGEGVEEPVVELVRRNGFEGRVIVGSFDAKKVKRVRRLAPELETSLLIARGVKDWAERCRDAGARFAHFCWEEEPEPHRLLDPALFAAAGAAGLKVVAWHEERPEVIREIVRLPIAAICSNRPDWI